MAVVVSFGEICNNKIKQKKNHDKKFGPQSIQVKICCMPTGKTGFFFENVALMLLTQNIFEGETMFQTQ